MTRPVLAAIALLLTPCPSRAADPQPLWEIDTSSAKFESQRVTSVGFSADGAKLIACVVLRERDKPRDLWKGAFDRLLTWNVQSRKEDLSVELGEGWHYGITVPHAVTSAGTVLIPGTVGGCEIRLSDGKQKLLFPGVGQPQGIWYDDVSRRAVWIKRVDHPVAKLCLAIAAGTPPPFEANQSKPMREKWSTARLTGEDLNDDDVALNGAVAVSPDLSRLAVATKQTVGHSLILFSIEHGEKLKLTEIAKVPGTHLGPIERVQFSPDGKTLATGSGESTVGLWDVTKAGDGWRPRVKIPTGFFTVSCLAFSPDGQTLTAGTTESRGHNLFMIDVASGKMNSSHHLEKPPTALGYSANGTTLATGHFLGKIRLWNVSKLRN